MARKHNTKHNRSRSNYKKRLADRGLGKTPRMKWTGMSTAQIQDAFANLPHYQWKLVTESQGPGYPSVTYQVRVAVV